MTHSSDEQSTTCPAYIYSLQEFSETFNLLSALTLPLTMNDNFYVLW